MARLTKKQQVRKQREAWKQALADGRVVKYNGGLSARSFLTVAEAEAFLESLRRAGLTGEILKVAP